MRCFAMRLAAAAAIPASALLCCLPSAGCAAHHPAAPAATAAAPAARPAGPVIVSLVSRHYTVVISAGPKAPLYSIRTADGQMLASNVTLDELRHTQVDLYDQLAPLLAPGSRATASADWASAWAGM